jgi:alkylation response protein AidB-like acyl-CoA dehydrogenase
VSSGHASSATTVDSIGARVQSAAREIAPHADEHDRDASYPTDGIAALWHAGLGNLTLSTEHGGDGLSLLETARAVRGIGAADASVALIWVMHLVHRALVEDPGFGLSNDARDAIIGSSLQGPALINALRVEPELGTPARGGVPATTATPTGPNAGNDHAAHDWRLTGHKIYCTGSHGLRWMLVWASVASEDPDEIRIGSFVVDAEAAGIEVRETWDHLGMRASASHDMILTNVAVPAGWTGALERAYGILDEVQQRRPGGGVLMGNAMERGVGSQRLLEAAQRGDILDRCLFMPLATATGAAGNSTALVGSPATVAAAMLDYYDIGVSTFLIRGYDPYEDLQGYGEVISLVRDGVAQRGGAGSQYDLQARR